MATQSRETLAPLAARLWQAFINDPPAAWGIAKEVFFAALAAGDLATAQAVPKAFHHAWLPARPSRAWAAYFHAILASDQHRFDAAEQFALTALRLAAGAELRGRACNELGILYDHLGRWADAIAFYRTGLAAFEQLDDRAYSAKLAKNLGTALVRACEAGALPVESLAEAESLERRAIASFEALPIPPLAAAAWNELGTVYKAQSRWAEAAACYERFRAFAADEGDHLGEGQGWNNLSEVLRGQGRLADAEAALRRARELVAGNAWETSDVQINLAHTCLDLGDHHRAAAAADAALDQVESLRAQLQTASARGDFSATLERVYAFRTHLARSAGRQDMVFALAERAKARTFAELLAGQRVAPHLAVPRRWLQQETALRRTLNDLYAAAATDSATQQAAIAAAEARWHELRLRIAQRDAEYGALGDATPLTPEAVQERLPDGSALLEYYADDQELLACLVQRKMMRVFPLGMALADLAGASFDHRGRPRGLVSEGGRLGHPWVLERLGQVLLEAVLPHLDAVELLCIVPHGALHHLPFGALSSGASGERLSQRIPAIVQVPSATVWLQHCQLRPLSTSTAPCIVGHNGSALKHAEPEARMIARSLNVEPLLGLAATRTTVMGQARSARWVHVACPGVFRPDQPLRSGLSLADGFLDVADTLRRVQLTADLVTLSGCETGLGHLRSGDEIVGLVRAWLYAGSPSVLVSLWTVDDFSTRLLMQEFYRRLAEFGPARALAQAQAALATLTADEIRDRALDAGLTEQEAQAELTRLTALWPEPQAQPLNHPYFYAPFVLHGRA
ncbi:MAG: hypothetical protein CVU38_07655 [Chloroflexi bacterium HGW-Chloroflexi-1]|nr:MAG: hypothetical protein CVU38_07655 [Chloroflexi bacterium HGW-Chloroflexi-1]